MSERKGDVIWRIFEKKMVVGKSGCRATCKLCKKEMQGLVDRLKKHSEECPMKFCELSL